MIRKKKFLMRTTQFRSDKQRFEEREQTSQSGALSSCFIDPRTLVPLDTKTLIDSVKKTGRLVLVTEETKTGATTAEIAAIVQEEAFDWLDAPIKRVNAPDTPVPFSPPLEQYFIPDNKRIAQAIRDIV